MKRSHRMHRRLSRVQRLLCWTLVSLLGWSPLAAANPEGANVVSGSAGVTQGGPDMRIVADHGSIIQWDRFSIPTGERVEFVQPGQWARVLNRVLYDASYINGSLVANGQVYIANPAGIYIGGNAIVDVGRLVATGGQLSDSDFLSGLDHFTNVDGVVENRGEILASDVLLAGRQVANHGRISVEDGSILMVSGDEIWALQHGSPVYLSITSGPTDLPGPAVENSGTLDAGRGRVRLAAGDLLGLSIQQTGDIRAQEIVLAAGEGSGVVVSGQLDASDLAAGGTGGEIQVLGDWIFLDGADLDASGDSGGGRILIGGEPNDATLPLARGTTVTGGSRLSADAVSNGDGGEIAIWSELTTTVDADLSATGGASGGDGGFVETSSKGNLRVVRAASVGAPAGAAGTWLLDPTNITIVDAATMAGSMDSQADDPEFDDPDRPDSIDLFPVGTFRPDDRAMSTVSNQAIIDALLDGGNVVITTQNTINGISQVDLGTSLGDITVAAPIVIDDAAVDALLFPISSASLELRASNDIFVNERIANDVDDSDPLVRDAFDLDIAIIANDILQPEDSSQFELGDVHIAAEIRSGGGAISIGGVHVTSTVAGTLTSDGGAITVIGQNSVTPDLQVLQPGSVSLAGDISAELAGEVGGSVIISGEESVTLTGSIRTPGGFVQSTGDDFVSTGSIQTDDGAVQVIHTGNVRVGGDISGDQVVLQAGSDGTGDVDLGGGAPTITARIINLTAGDNLSTGTGRVIIGSASFRGLTGGAPESFSLAQDLAITDAQIPQVGQFGGSVAGMAYRLDSTQTVTIGSPGKVQGSNLLLVGGADGIDDPFAFTNPDTNPLRPQTLELRTAGNLTVDEGITNKVLLETSDSATDPTVLVLHAGSDGEGDLTLAGSATFIADDITLRAGDGPDFLATSQVALDPSADIHFAVTGAGAQPPPLVFSLEQDAAIDESRVDIDGAPDPSYVPDASQFVAGVAGIDYTIQSNEGSLVLNDPSKLFDTNLHLFSGIDPTGDDPTVIDIASPLTVRSAEVGSVGDFTLDFGIGQGVQDARILFSDPTTSVLTLRGGGDAGAGNLGFGPSVAVAANEIRLISAGPSARVDAVSNDPVFRGGSGRGTSPTNFVLRQEAPIVDSALPIPTQFGDGAGPSGTYALRSDTSQGIDLDSLDFSPVITINNLSAFLGTGLLLLSGSAVELAALVDQDLVLNRPVEIRADRVLLEATIGDPLNPLPQVVDARNLTRVTSFDGNSFVPDGAFFDLDSAPATTPSSFEIFQTGNFDDASRLPDATVFERPVMGVGGVADMVYALTTLGVDQHGSIRIDDATANAVRESQLLLDVRLDDQGQTIDFAGALDLQSLRVLKLGGLDVTPGASIRAQDIIEIEAGRGGSGDLTIGDGVILEAPTLALVAGAGTSTLVSDGNLSFGAGTELKSNNVLLNAGAGGLLANSMVDARNVVFDRFDPDPNNPVGPWDLSLAIVQDGDIAATDMPLATQFDPGGGLAEVDDYSIVSFGDVAIDDLSRFNARNFIATAVDTLTLSSSGDLDFGGVTNSVQLEGNSVVLESTGGAVFSPPANVELAGPGGFSLNHLAIRQNSAVTSANLPLISNFTTGVLPLLYEVESLSGGITVDDPFAMRVGDTFTSVKLSPGPNEAVSITADLDLAALLVDLDGHGSISIDTDSITTLGAQFYGSPVSFARDTTLDARFDGLWFLGNSGTSSSVDASGSLNLITDGFIEFGGDVNVHGDLGINAALSDPTTTNDRNTTTLLGFLVGAADRDPAFSFDFGVAPNTIDAHTIATIHSGDDLSIRSATGSVTLGPSEGLSVAGDLTIDAPNGDVTVGDVSSLGTVRIVADTLGITRRPGAASMRSDGSIAANSGVDLVASAFDIQTSNIRLLGAGRDPVIGVPDPTTFTGPLSRFVVATAKRNGGLLTANDLRIPVSFLLGNEALTLGFPGTGAIGLDLSPDGPSATNLTRALSAPVPQPPASAIAEARLAATEPLERIGIHQRPTSGSQHNDRTRRAAIYDDVAYSWQHQVSEARILADDAERAATKYEELFGAGGELGDEIRSVLQAALDDYRRTTRVRRVVGFEFRRFIRNRPSSQFEAYRTLEELSSLFRHHRRSGLNAGEYRRIQSTWIERIQPDGISAIELAEAIHPSRYVRGSDILDTFGD